MPQPSGSQESGPNDAPHRRPRRFLRALGALLLAGGLVGCGGAGLGASGNRSTTLELDSLGAVDGFVRNDGYFDAHEMDEQVWRRVIDIDLTGVFLGAKRALQEMLPRGSGRIINIASVAGLNGTGGGVAYVAAKHGVVGLTRQMAVAYSARGLTINAVCPGPILTGLRQHSQQILGAGVPDMSGRGIAVSEEQVRAVVPAGRRGTVDDIAAAVCFLASEEAAYITGHTLVVDGGWRAK